jgi:hypothetical protein
MRRLTFWSAIAARRKACVVFKLLKKEFPDIGPSGELIIVDVLEGRCRSLCDGSLTFALSDAPGED